MFSSDFSEKATYNGDSGALLMEFKKRCSLYREGGSLVLRGTEAATLIEDLSLDHLKPIRPSVWKTLNWKDGVHPPKGIYAVPEAHRLECSDAQSLMVKVLL